MHTKASAPEDNKEISLITGNSITPVTQSNLSLQENTLPAPPLLAPLQQNTFPPVHSDRHTRSLSYAERRLGQYL